MNATSNCICVRTQNAESKNKNWFVLTWLIYTQLDSTKWRAYNFNRWWRLTNPNITWKRVSFWEIRYEFWCICRWNAKLVSNTKQKSFDTFAIDFLFFNAYLLLFLLFEFKRFQYKKDIEYKFSEYFTLGLCSYSKLKSLVRPCFCVENYQVSTRSKI